MPSRYDSKASTPVREWLMESKVLWEAVKAGKGQTAKTKRDL